MVWAQSMLGQTLKGQYRLDGLLGEGAMGVVFRGVNLAMDKAVAIKMMRKETFDTPDAVERFSREARVWSQLNHPAITQVFDFGVQEGQPFLVMELVEGVDLSEVLKRERLLEPLRAVKLVRQLAGALEEAHRLGVIHRDIKPANLKLLRYQPAGKILLKVLDFGMAKQVGKADQRLTAPGILVGTPKYVAPEQITENPLIDGRTDLYAAGVLFYEILTGDAPFLGSPHEVLLAHLGSEPKALPDSVPAMVRSVVMRLLRKQPDERFPNAGALEQALDECEMTLRAVALPSGMFAAVGSSGPGSPPPPSAHSGPGAAIPPSVTSQRGASAGTPVAAAPSARSQPPQAPSARSQPSEPSAPVGQEASIPPSQPQAGRSVLLAAVFIITMLGSAVLFYGLRHYLPLQRTVASFVPSFHVPQDEEVWLSLRALEAERDKRQWAVVLRGVQYLEQRYGSTLLPEQVSEMTSLRQRATLEQPLQEVFEKLVAAATRPDPEEVVRLHGQLSSESSYFSLAQPYYDTAVESYVAMHLSKAEELRLAGNCTEYLAEIQKLLNAVPGHPQARGAERKTCPPPPSEQTPPPATMVPGAPAPAAP
jgi:serine/threonine-protein kinase